MTARMGLAVAAFSMTALMINVSCRPRLAPRYDRTIRCFNKLEEIPIVVAARIEPDATSVAGEILTVDAVPFDVLLYKTKIFIENVLKGDVSPGAKSLYYYSPPSPMGNKKMGFVVGKTLYELLLLRREAGQLRTFVDILSNCNTPIRSGSHLGLVQDDKKPLAERVIDLILTRGAGIDDKSMAEAVFNPVLPDVSLAYTTRVLKHLAEIESPAVRVAACRQLRNILTDDTYIEGTEAQRRIAVSLGIPAAEFKRWRSQRLEGTLEIGRWTHGMSPVPNLLTGERQSSGLALCVNDRALGITSVESGVAKRDSTLSQVASVVSTN